MMMLQDMTDPEDASAETTAVCGSSYFSAAAAVSVETADAADVETTAVCGSSFCFAAAAASADAAAMMMAVDADANINVIPFQQNNS